METSTKQTPSVPGKGGRRLRKLIVVVLVLAGILAGVDFGVASFAEHKVSQKAREQYRLADDPSVSVHGFPFATQASAGHYDHVTVDATGIPVGDVLQDVELNAELYGVNAPLSDLLNGNVAQIKIDRVKGEAKIKAADVERALNHQAPNGQRFIENLKIEHAAEKYVRSGDENDDGNVSGESGDDDIAGAKLTGEMEIAGTRTTVVVFVMLQMKDNTIRVSPERLKVGGDGPDSTEIPVEVAQSLLPKFAVNIAPGNLPFTVTPTAVETEDGALKLKGEARKVTFTGNDTP